MPKTNKQIRKTIILELFDHILQFVMRKLERRSGKGAEVELLKKRCVAIAIFGSFCLVFLFRRSFCSFFFFSREDSDCQHCAARSILYCFTEFICRHCLLRLPRFSCSIRFSRCTLFALFCNRWVVVMCNSRISHNTKPKPSNGMVRRLHHNLHRSHVCLCLCNVCAYTIRQRRFSLFL